VETDLFRPECQRCAGATGRGSLHLLSRDHGVWRMGLGNLDSAAAEKASAGTFHGQCFV